MLTILFTLVLGMNTYAISDNCNKLGAVYFPKDDAKEVRVISVCTKYGAEQNREIVEHELLHACMHDHVHSFTTDAELYKHLNEQAYTEEQLASTLAPCISANRDKLIDALEEHHVKIQSAKQRHNR
jgi:hypothetical protein